MKLSAYQGCSHTLDIYAAFVQMKLQLNYHPGASYRCKGRTSRSCHHVFHRLSSLMPLFILWLLLAWTQYLHTACIRCSKNVVTYTWRYPSSGSPLPSYVSLSFIFSRSPDVVSPLVCVPPRLPCLCLSHPPLFPAPFPLCASTFPCLNFSSFLPGDARRPCIARGMRNWQSASSPCGKYSTSSYSRNIYHICSRQPSPRPLLFVEVVVLSSW